MIGNMVLRIDHSFFLILRYKLPIVRFAVFVVRLAFVDEVFWNFYIGYFLAERTKNRLKIRYTIHCMSQMYVLFRLRVDMTLPYNFLGGCYLVVGEGGGFQ